MLEISMYVNYWSNLVTLSYLNEFHLLNQDPIFLLTFPSVLLKNIRTDFFIHRTVSVFGWSFYNRDFSWRYMWIASPHNHNHSCQLTKSWESKPERSIDDPKSKTIAGRDGLMERVRRIATLGVTQQQQLTQITHPMYVQANKHRCFRTLSDAMGIRTHYLDIQTHYLWRYLSWLGYERLRCVLNS